MISLTKKEFNNLVKSEVAKFINKHLKNDLEQIEIIGYTALRKKKYTKEFIADLPTYEIKGKKHRFYRLTDIEQSLASSKLPSANEQALGIPSADQIEKQNQELIKNL